MDLVFLFASPFRHLPCQLERQGLASFIAVGLEPPRISDGIGDPRDAGIVQGLTAGRKIGRHHLRQ